MPVRLESYRVVWIVCIHVHVLEARVYIVFDVLLWPSQMNLLPPNEAFFGPPKHNPWTLPNKILLRKNTGTTLSPSLVTSSHHLRSHLPSRIHLVLEQRPASRALVSPCCTRFTGSLSTSASICATGSCALLQGVLSGGCASCTTP
jgi:hypothetical protein